MSIHMRALAFAVITFLAGIGIGMLIEEQRMREIRETMLELEALYNDARLLAKLLGEEFNASFCDEMLKWNLEYNARIYEFGVRLDEYEKANRFTPELEGQKTLYNLLQFQFLLNSIELKRKCNFTYKNVVHLYRRRGISLKEEVDTKTMASILWDLKMRCGNKIMLIPLQADANLTSINAFLEKYQIRTYPATIIDDKAIEGLVSLSELIEICGC